jgi:Protein of unknown function (DUF3455)
MKKSNWRGASFSTMTTVAVMLLVGCAAEVSEPLESESDELSAACLPHVPPPLAVPAGQRLAFANDAVGVQIYGCDATANGYDWVFRAPEANLYGHKGRLAGTHYAGPTWEANDGSTVAATKLAEVAVPNAIPWLLLGAVSHAGKGRMTDVTYIHRLDTTAGKAPASGCDASHVGETARVDYTATYYFYEARGKK